MARTIWRHEMDKNEEVFWVADEMAGWRTAFEGYVEDQARENGYKKYVIHDRENNVVAKGEVRKLILPTEESLN